jgi:hypothetical protein
MHSTLIAAGHHPAMRCWPLIQRYRISSALHGAPREPALALLKRFNGWTHIRRTLV